MPAAYLMKREQASRVAAAPCHLTPPLKVALALPGDGMIYDLPFVDGGLVLAFDQLKNLTVAVDEATWAVRWEAKHYFSLLHEGHGLSWRQGGHVVSLATGRNVRAFAAGVGIEKVQIGGVLVAQGFKDKADLICAASISDGRDLWEYKPEGPHPTISGIFCADERAVYFGLYDCSVMALALEDGRVLWHQPDAIDAAALAADGLRKSPPFAADGVMIVYGDVVIVRFPPNIAGLSAHDGRVLWSAPVGGTQDGYLYDGRYYATTHRGEYFILDPLTGKILFSADLKAALPKSIQIPWPLELAPMLVSETHTFVGVRDGWLLAFERDTGKYVWNFRPKKKAGAISKKSPGYFASANGRLYYADLSPCLYCLEEEEPTDPVLKAQRAAALTAGAPKRRKKKA